MIKARISKKTGDFHYSTSVDGHTSFKIYNNEMFLKIQLILLNIFRKNMLIS